MSQQIRQHHISEGMSALAQLDPHVQQALTQVGEPLSRHRPPGFRTLVATIVSQQISTEAANAIMGRVEVLLPQLSPEDIIHISEEALREAGLSRRKVEYTKGLAEAIIDRKICLESFSRQSDEEVIHHMTQLRGFGRWSAEIYLMFSLGRLDIFPADDLAIRIALGKLKGLEEKPTPAQARAMVAHWAPYRSIGSLFLWHYYRGAPDV
ncbi:DNA-3-methyladenine glycosylase family protein [Vibrio mangrovi]|uniref:DNA-3-methyladenine glycosylase II n=1 Tax=Vibrio mangrovi TaxID=474394 RepID=A0A1Y6IVY5_9VIBR|nr:DNA-3-methyladenine glycosylase [Vibrio mangrovi]MDW6005077.1 DNA-3-methyladenine glycosylase [Vibrio mangrovi]SMS01845.1 DNA-3-methyladenine glycosylase [Vibrio mangrovi]